LRLLFSDLAAPGTEMPAPAALCLKADGGILAQDMGFVNALIR
jgi:hypothetical protein